ncbi:hypothetical protein GUJ93_ZPchr0003g17327 [Zizania palustris]|uniref:Uncharacterized protein n=1 Tax=Zizania palustris TaxID=103762 RepID=A0A8J5SDX0_ZIZPA|nr:hypothetical protein GUJ93_ZPchr0003g17327 [Zizania palustris]
MTKKSPSKKALALGGGSDSIQALVAVVAAMTVVKTPLKHLEVFDLHPPSDKFEQTLELWATMSTEESID